MYQSLTLRRDRRSPARRIVDLTHEIDHLTPRITDAINAHTPELLRRHSVGPDTAAALLLTRGDNQQRLTSEASLPRSAASARSSCHPARPNADASTPGRERRPLRVLHRRVSV